MKVARTGPSDREIEIVCRGIRSKHSSVVLRIMGVSAEGQLWDGMTPLPAAADLQSWIGSQSVQDEHAFSSAGVVTFRCPRCPKGTNTPVREGRLKEALAEAISAGRSRIDLRSLLG